MAVVGQYQICSKKINDEEDEQIYAMDTERGQLFVYLGNNGWHKVGDTIDNDCSHP